MKQNLDNNEIQIMIVGNKLDINDETFANGSMIDDHVNYFKADYFKTSARTLAGTEKLFGSIISTIMDSQFFIRQQTDKYRNANESLTDSMLNNTCDSFYRKLLESNKSSSNTECSNIKSNTVNHFNSFQLFLRKLFCLI